VRSGFGFRRPVVGFWFVVSWPFLFGRTVTLGLRRTISCRSSTSSSSSSTATEEESLLDHLEECWPAGRPDSRSRLPSPPWSSSLTYLVRIFIIKLSLVLNVIVHQLIDIDLRHSGFFQLSQSRPVLL